MKEREVTILLSSVLSRVNLVSACLPDELQEDVEDIKMNIISVLREHKCNISLSDVPSDFALDMVSLYKELNIISRDLGVCLLFMSDEALEDAVSSIGYVIINMANMDSVFGCCYENAKSRVLK